VPYECSASLAPSVPQHGWDTDAEPSVLFARTGQYLSQTERSRGRFVRVLGIKATVADGKHHLAMKDSRYELAAGRTYDLDLFYSAPRIPAHARSVRDRRRRERRADRRPVRLRCRLAIRPRDSAAHRHGTRPASATATPCPI
jgi:hypothetical protein